MYPLRETPLEQLPLLLKQHGRLWLIMYQVEPRHPKYPAEEWLDRNAYRARSQWYGSARIALYTLPEERPERVSANFGDEIALTEAWVTARTAQPGDLLGVGLRWRAQARPSANYTTFVHLLDARGRNRTGEDAEPMWGLTHTADWTPGTEMVQRQGVPLPPDTPPGDYLVEVGLYRQDNGQRLPVLGGPPADRVVLGTVRVGAMPTLPQVAHVSSVEVNASQGRVKAIGFTAPGDRWHPGEPVTVETITGPVVLTPRADPYRSEQAARLTVVWEVLEAADAPVVSQVRLQPEGGGAPIAAVPAAPSLRVPASEWPVGASVIEDFRTVFPPGAARGRYRVEAGFAEEGAASAVWTEIGVLDATR
jgi:hypothetical protein